MKVDRKKRGGEIKIYFSEAEREKGGKPEMS